MKLKLDNQIIITESIAIILLLLNISVKKVSNIFIAIFLLFAICFFRRRRTLLREPSKTIYFSILTSVITMSVIYLSGLYSGFESNYASVFNRIISIKDVIVNISIIIMTEMLRPIIVEQSMKNKSKFKLMELLLIIMFSLIDAAITTKMYVVSSIYQLFIMLCCVIIRSMSCNYLLNFMVKKDMHISRYIYRAVFDAYIYIIPIVPILNIYYEAVFFLVYPYIYYRLYKKYFERTIKDEKIPIKERFENIVSIVLFVSFVALISGNFKYTLMAIGSESMTGAINKGDTVLIKRIDSVNELKIDDVVLYYKNDTKIVHRIKEIYKSDDGKLMFVTKGDANQNQDPWILQEKDIEGKVLKRIKWIGYPSVWLSEFGKE